MVGDATGGRTSKGKDRPNEGGLRATLMRSLLPTPCESNADRGGRGELIGFLRGTRGYRGAMLPTPTAGDAIGSGSRNTPTSKAHRGVSLTDWARGDGGTGRRLLPTPTADSATNRQTRYAQGGMPLTMAVQLLPTPRAAEWKGVGPIGSKSHLHGLSRGYLGATMQERSGSTGRLNPRFVEWMMGFPRDWTEVDSPASETRSSRKSSK
jgi:hypothetical protein